MSDASTPAGPDDEVDAPGRLVVDRETVGAAVVVRVMGEIDMASTELLDEQLLAAEADAVLPGPVVLDLTGVHFLASMGLALLVSHHERCADLGMSLRVVASRRQVLRPIEITGLDQKLDIVASVDDALAT